MLLSARVRNLNPSSTLMLSAMARQLKAQGKPVIDLSSGEPDSITPENIRKAAKQGIDRGETHYTDVAGTYDLRKAIVAKFKRDNDSIYAPDEIVVSCGAKHSLYNAIMTLCEQGDEVLLPTPVWTTYSEQVKLAGGKPVYIPLKPPFKLTADDIVSKITRRTRILIIASPNNPTGAIIDKEELSKIAALAIKHHMWVISDEIYESLFYDQPPVSIVSLGTEIKKQTIVINGVSKTYAMTGWRIGYAAGPKEVISAMSQLQGQVTSNASSISQVAAQEALNGSQESVYKMRKLYRKRRQLICKFAESTKGIFMIEPEGAFYGFISIKDLLGKQYPTSAAWCEAVLFQSYVAVVPGEAFLSPGFIRVSFAASEQQLSEGLARIQSFIHDQKN